MVTDITTEEQKGQVTPKEITAPSVSSTETILDKAEATAKRMEDANKRAEELLTRQEALAARILLAGRAEAGQVTRSPQEIEKEVAEKQALDIVKRFR